MRLLPLEAFADVFGPLVGKRVGFIRPHGNVGDRLIELATFQLFNAFGIDWRVQDPGFPLRGCGEPAEEVDELVFGGGGNMGALYRNNVELRKECLALGLPVTIFPQSFTSPEDRPYKRVYVRETASLEYCQQAVLAPDLALGLDYRNRLGATRRTGVFIRKDREGVVRRPWFSRDPAKICNTPRQYLELAARYERIITDRLHFAICGLIVGRDTTLLPNSYHKNRSMYETWLGELGCKFATRIERAIRPNAALGRSQTPPTAVGGLCPGEQTTVQDARRARRSLTVRH